MSGKVAGKVSIAEARIRRTDPAWRRRHKLADLNGMALVALLVVVAPVAGLLFRPVGLALAVGVLVVAPLALLSSGPSVGLERRTALLVAIPLVNLVVLVPAVWRAAHLHIQHWQGPLQPGWDDQVWLPVGAGGVVLWLASVAGLVLLLT